MSSSVAPIAPALASSAQKEQFTSYCLACKKEVTYDVLAKGMLPDKNGKMRNQVKGYCPHPSKALAEDGSERHHTVSCYIDPNGRRLTKAEKEALKAEKAAVSAEAHKE
jgi:hypothetical protein